MLFLVATSEDHYRKPNTGMWDYFVKNLNGGVKVNLQKSIYCGDAAGRPKVGNRPKDHSDVDLKFAINMNVPFKLPEELFLG